MRVLDIHVLTYDGRRIAEHLTHWLDSRYRESPLVAKPYCELEANACDKLRNWLSSNPKFFHIKEPQPGRVSRHPVPLEMEHATYFLGSRLTHLKAIALIVTPTKILLHESEQ